MFFFLILQRILFSLGGSFLHYANHFKLYSSFCASHSKAQKVLNPGTKISTFETHHCDTSTPNTCLWLSSPEFHNDSHRDSEIRLNCSLSNLTITDNDTFIITEVLGLKTYCNITKPHLCFSFPPNYFLENIPKLYCNLSQRKPLKLGA